MSDLRFVKLPSKYIEFLKKNPKVAECIGRVVCLCYELEAKGQKKVADALKAELLSTNVAVNDLLEDGTKHEFFEFVKYAFSINSNEIKSMDNATPEQYSFIKRELSKSGPTLITEFEMTE